MFFFLLLIEFKLIFVSWNVFCFVCFLFVFCLFFVLFFVCFLKWHEKKGKYQPLSAQTSCNPCLSGQYNPVEEQETCLFCDAGRFSNNRTGSNQNNNQGFSSCDLCDKGKFAETIGHEECNQCSAGRSLFYIILYHIIQIFQRIKSNIELICNKLWNKSIDLQLLKDLELV